MKMPWRHIRLMAPTILAFCLGPAAITVRAQYELPPPPEPQFLKLRISDAALQLLLSEEKDRGTFSGAPSFNRDTSLVEPTATITMRGSAYHPNLLQFSLQPVIGYDWYNVRDTSQNPPHESQSERLINYNATADILNEKPYAVHLDATHQIVDRQDTFFGHQRVDSTLYDIRSGYNSGPVPVSIWAFHSEEKNDDPFRPYDNVDNSVVINSHNNRVRGVSSLNYVYSDYRYSESDFADTSVPTSFTMSGTRQTVNATDDENLGPSDKYHLYSGVNYEQQDDTNLNVKVLHVGEALRIEHTEKLHSLYNYNFNDIQNGDSESRTHQGTASIHHQLYNSLASSADIDGEHDEDQSVGNSLVTEKVGGGINETYSKIIPWDGKLMLNYGHREDWTIRDAGGSSLAILNESHVLSDGEITFLNELNPDNSSILVTDASGARVYRRDLDYLVIPHGPQIQIQRIVGGFIPNGSIVLVSYNATSSPSDHYRTIGNSYGFSLSLWNHFTIYANRGESRNEGSASETVQDVSETTIGANVAWQHFQAGAERVNYDSNLSSYKSTRLYETFQYNLSRQTSFFLDLRQQEVSFNDSGDNERIYSFIGRLETHSIPALILSLEAAANLDRGIGTQGYARDIYSGTAYATYQVGKLAARLNLQYQQSTEQSEKTDSQYASFTLARSF